MPTVDTEVPEAEVDNSCEDDDLEKERFDHIQYMVDMLRGIQGPIVHDSEAIARGRETTRKGLEVSRPGPYHPIVGNLGQTRRQ